MGFKVIILVTICVFAKILLVNSSSLQCTDDNIGKVEECAKRAFVIGNRNFVPPKNAAELDGFCE